LRVLVDQAIYILALFNVLHTFNVRLVSRCVGPLFQATVVQNSLARLAGLLRDDHDWDLLAAIEGVDREHR
jgi:hypothetical protein